MKHVKLNQICKENFFTALNIVATRSQYCNL